MASSSSCRLEIRIGREHHASAVFENLWKDTTYDAEREEEQGRAREQPGETVLYMAGMKADD